MAAVNEKNFLEVFSHKWNKFGNCNSEALKETWKRNLKTMNQVIIDNIEGKIQKHVVSAVTGSAKTENIITYCSILENVKVLISTNLTDEADRIAKAINEEAVTEKAVAYHSKNSTRIQDAVHYQIVVVSHEFYRRNFKGTDAWALLTSDRDLIIIDEALDTLVELSVSSEEIKRIIVVAERMLTWKRYKDNELLFNICKALEKNLDDLVRGRRLLGTGSILIHGEKDDAFYNTDIEDKEHFNKFAKTMYQPLISIFEEDKEINFNEILSGENDASKNNKIRASIKNSLEILQGMFDEQVYITSKRGYNSYNMVIDSTPSKSIVCFDATSSVNDIYKLRAKYHNDLLLVPKVDYVRNYENVNIHLAKTNTGRDTYCTVEDALRVLSAVKLGEKSLIVVHKLNKGVFSQIAKSHFKDKQIEVAHWGALTGLNYYQDFDTCVITGLLHKPISFSQNRAIINATEDTAFGEEQKIITQRIATTDIVAEIIQSINRIRVRRTIDEEGRCKSANIYITLPIFQNNFYERCIKSEMPKSKIYNWELTGAITVSEQQEGYLPAIIEWLEGNLNEGDEISIYEPRNSLNIRSDSYSKIIKRASFSDRLNDFGFQVLKKQEKDKRGRVKKKLVQYISRIS